MSLNCPPIRVILTISNLYVPFCCKWQNIGSKIRHLLGLRNIIDAVNQNSILRCIDKKPNFTLFNEMSENSSLISSLASSSSPNIFNNIAGSCERKIEGYYKVETEAEVIALLQRENKADVVFRAAAGRHSWSPTVLDPTDKNVFLVDASSLGTKREDFIPISLNHNHYLIPAPPSFTQRELCDYANSLRPQLSVCSSGAVADSIRIGGFLGSSCCHGSGLKVAPASDCVKAIRMVMLNPNSRIFQDSDEKADDSTIVVALFISDEIAKLSPSQLQRIATGKDGTKARIISSLDGFKQIDPEFKKICDEFFPQATLIDFARGNFGTLGIITELWIHCEPRFNVRAVDEVIPMEELLQHPSSESDTRFVNEYLLGKDYLELFYTPFNQMENDLPVIGKMQVKSAVRCNSRKKRDIMQVDIFHNLYNSRINTEVEGCLVGTGGEIIHHVIKHCPENAPTILNVLSSFAYDRALTISTGNSLCCLLGALKLRCLRDPRNERVEDFNDFSLYELHVFHDFVDPEMEIPIDLKTDPTAKVFRAAWFRTLDLVRAYAERKQYPCNIMIHCRFNKASKSILSPLYTSGHHPDIIFATIECVCGYSRDAKPEYLQA